MKRLLAVSTLFLCILFSILSCSTIEGPYTASDPSLNFPYNPSFENQKSDSTKVVNKVNPWELWMPNKDMDGLPLANFTITAGDELSHLGNRQAALQKYLTLEKTRLLPQEEEALVYRIASSQLSLQKPQDALRTLSDYFTKHNEAIDYVSPVFCILLGYAYGHNNNSEQSLAWFSRVNKLNPNDRAYVSIATSAVKDVLSRVPADKFEQTAGLWSSDEYIRGLISEERAMRAQRGVVTGDNQFAQLPLTGSSPITGQTLSGVVNIGIVLPLTGKYALLGNNTRNGLNLALSEKVLTDNKGQSLRLEPVYRDTGGGTVDAPSHIVDLINNAKPAVLIGPLLSEEAVPAADTARNNRIPMITFSKKNTFITGGGIFRLGATPQSQVDSILSKTYDELRITQYALVYANDVNGQEFAETYRAEFAKRGAKLVFERSYNKDDTAAYLAIAQELEQHPVQAILFPDNLLAASRFFSNINPRKLEGMKIIGTASWDDSAQLSRYNTILNGAIFVSPFFSASQEENIRNFVTLYKDKFKSQPDFLAAQGYDTGVLVLNSLSTAYAQNSTFENSLIRYREYAGLTGKISVSPSGEISRKFKLVEFREGTVRELISTNNTNIVMRGNEVVATGTPVN